MTDALQVLLQAPDLVSVLCREVKIVVVDVSKSGCRFESSCRLEKGAAGLLRVTIDNVEYADDVRVTRCEASDGGSGLYQVGAEFLWTTSPHERSLRRVVGKLQGAGLAHSVRFGLAM